MDPKPNSEPEKAPKEDELVQLAKKELLRDIKCASIRAEQFGAHSWAKPQKYVPSKRFLRHMLVSTSRHNERESDRWKEKRDSKKSSEMSERYKGSRKGERHSKHKHSRWDTGATSKHKKSQTNGKKNHCGSSKVKEKRTK